MYKESQVDDDDKKSVTFEEQSLKIKGLKYTFGKVKARINA
jgi:hypothetical protein